MVILKYNKKGKADFDPAHKTSEPSRKKKIENTTRKREEISEQRLAGGWKVKGPTLLEVWG